MRPTHRAAFGVLALAACDPSAQSGSIDATKGDRVAEIEAEQLALADTDDPEHPSEAPSGVFGEWSDGPSIHIALARPELAFRFVNLDEEPHLVRWRLRGDDGTQNRRVQTPIEVVTVGARSTYDGTTSLDRLGVTPRTFSGLASLAFETCALDGTDCAPATAEPLFFHRAADGTWLVYSADVLCSTYACGDVFGNPAAVEPGTSRVLGGSPLTSSPKSEEPDVLPPATGEPDDNAWSQGGVR